MDRDANGSRLRNIIAATVIGAALAGGGYLIGRNNDPPPAPVQIRAAPSPVTPVVPSAPIDVTLQRADLIRLAAAAADASSGGPSIEEMLEGKRFVIRIPFGCGELSNEKKRAFGARFTADDQTLRISVQPEDWTQLPWIAAELSRRDANGAEGFWIPRPWTQSETCPADKGDPANPASSLGIAQVFNADSSRVGQRRGRPFEATVQLDADDVDIGKGLRLVLEGRVARWSTGGETVLCRAAQAYERPLCLVSAKLDLIAVENASNGDRLADWRF